MTTHAIENYIMETTPQRVVDRYTQLKEYARTHDFGALDEDVVVIDTETTGVSFKHDELTQIAAARMVRGEIKEWFVTFVNPGKPIPEDIVHLTNIHDSDVSGAPDPEEAVARLVEFVGSSYLVAHNAAFDRHFCTKPASGAALKNNVWVDSLDLARIAVPRLKSHRLTDLVRTFDTPVSTHRADADVEATCAVYRILLAAVATMPNDLVSVIAQFDDGEQWPTVMVFKHFAESDGSSFNLRSLRYQTVGRNDHRPRVDANNLIGDPARGVRFATEDEVREAFSPAGVVGRMYDRFEARDEQVEMAEAVNAAFADSVNLAIEAGTGVGKSMAYLIPSVIAARKNDITVGIATKTNALLDQLVNHELPLLSESCDGVSFCSLKGFSHYPCLRSIERVLKAGPGMRQVQDGFVSQAPALAGLLSFIEQSEYDDIDTLKIDYRALPRYEITTTSNDCLRRKCPYFGQKCYVHGARLQAECSDIVVTNQSLLFCDVAAEGGLLPPIRYWVVDEAHGAENEARRAFSTKIDADEIKRVIGKVDSSNAARNVFIRAERRLSGEIDVSDERVRDSLTDEERALAEGTGLSGGDTLLFALSGRAKRAGDIFGAAATEFCAHLSDLLAFDVPTKGRSYDQVDIWINDEVRASDAFKNLVELGHMMYESAEKLIKACTELVGVMEDVKGAASVQGEIASTALALKDLLLACEIILFDGPDTYAYAAHLFKRKNVPHRGSEYLEALMMNVGDTMNETLYARTQSVVFTSATMTVADSFGNFNTAMGLGAAEQSAVRTAKLDSSYDFDTHMTVYVVKDMPEPNNQRYLDELEKLLIGVHKAQQGSTLSLFTNRREMEKAFEVVRDALHEDDLRVVCQKWGVSVKGLRDDFIADEHLSLFALKSFWEGFDAPGATLKTVVIPKLPFTKPSDPLSCARAQIDSSAWSHYVLPQAVLEIRQAAGRLIRSSTDTGNLVLADHRLVSKGYGKVFLKSLPSSNIKVLPAKDIIEDIRASRDA